MFLSVANTFIGSKINHKKVCSTLKFSLAAILKICKLTPLPGSDYPRLFFWNSPWPVKAFKTIKRFVAIFLGFNRILTTIDIYKVVVYVCLSCYNSRTTHPRAKLKAYSESALLRGTTAYLRCLTNRKKSSIFWGRFNFSAAIDWFSALRLFFIPKPDKNKTKTDQWTFTKFLIKNWLSDFRCPEKGRAPLVPRQLQRSENTWRDNRRLKRSKMSG